MMALGTCHQGKQRPCCCWEALLAFIHPITHSSMYALINKRGGQMIKVSQHFQNLIVLICVFQSELSLLVLWQPVFKTQWMLLWGTQCPPRCFPFPVVEKSLNSFLLLSNPGPRNDLFSDFPRNSRLSGVKGREGSGFADTNVLFPLGMMRAGL